MTAAAAYANQSARLVSWSGTEINIAAGNFSGILSDGGTTFSTEDMTLVDQSIQASGLATQGFITLLLAETSAGLSLITLMDGITDPSPPGAKTMTAATSFVPETATWQYNVDAGGTFDSFPLGDQTVLSGAFQWQSGIESEAFAISNLAFEDIGSITYNEILPGGLSPNNTIQILTSDGGTWSIANQFDFDPADAGGPDFQYFDFEITAIPTPGVLAMLAVAGLSGRRRRRS
ncbi:MAG: hypothetical protein MK116_04545 [Phycisphaerales bacterium]|nr:hypothetical protein [Phycisphaerales bacterium]